MAFSKTISRYLWRHWWDRLLTVALFLFVFLAATAEAFAWTYQNKIYPGVFIGSVPVGGMTRTEAETAIDATIDLLREHRLVFVFRDRTVTVPMVLAATDDPDLSYEVISYDVQATVARALQHGRGQGAGIWYQRTLGLFQRISLEPTYVWREETVREILSENLAALETPAQDAMLDLSNGIPRIHPAREGIVFDYGAAVHQANAQLSGLVFTPIQIKLKREVPQLTQDMAASVLADVTAMLRTQEVRIVYDTNTWFWPASSVNDLLEIRLTEQGAAAVGISDARLFTLLKPITEAIDIEPQEPKFALEAGKVVEFKTSADGRRVSPEATRIAWEEQLFDPDILEVTPVVTVVEPKQRIADVNDLGIAELLGTGKSSFAGSPRNRRHNIRIGAESVNGTIVPPAEEFSLIETLGTIDDTTGYLPELVIKGNKTIPEYGGGLCQIGTTTFRATLASGLPVTARRNHSYTVSYYFDDDGLPGTDATIYYPAPDYRFLNDTGSNVLILTRIEGDILFFEFWGAKDGRTVEQSKTRVWDRVPPPPTKYVETLDLKPGEIKCTESPHNGLKAAFDYTITYDDGTVSAETFTSSYRPWQEVCLVGVEELSEEVGEDGLQIEDADSAAIVN